MKKNGIHVPKGFFYFFPLWPSFDDAGIYHLVMNDDGVVRRNVQKKGLYLLTGGDYTIQ